MSDHHVESEGRPLHRRDVEEQDNLEVDSEEADGYARSFERGSAALPPPQASKSIGQLAWSAIHAACNMRVLGHNIVILVLLLVLAVALWPRHGVLAPNADVADQQMDLPTPRRASCPLPVAGADGVSPSMIIIRGGRVFAPEDRGLKDVLVAGGKVVALGEPGDALLDAVLQHGAPQVIDATGLFVVPGLVDIHVHVTGGGGELGPESRTPQARLSELLAGGTTTVVGTLGTDSVSKTPAALLTMVRGLNRLPMSAYMYTGSYRSEPVQTVTGDVLSDISLLETVVGVGEIAISDHRGSQPSPDVLRRIAADTRVGGMLGGKVGVAYFHLGAGPTLLQPLWDIVNNTPVPFMNLLPTHISRNMDLAQEGAKWVQAGGNIDLSVGSKAPAILKMYASTGIDLSHVSISSDAYGSLPHFAADGRLLSYDYARPQTLLGLVRKMVLTHNWTLPQILPLVTSNPARFLGLPKGRIAVSLDADILVMNSTLIPQYVLAKGIVALTPTCVVHDMTEPQ